MSDRPTLDEQFADQRRRGRKPTQTPMQITRWLINALLWVWLLISLVALAAAVLGLALLMRAVF